MTTFGDVVLVAVVVLGIVCCVLFVQNKAIDKRNNELVRNLLEVQSDYDNLLIIKGCRSGKKIEPIHK